ncbi:hypothetical protein C4J89_2513 [Pseudomonas sp. R4-35-07]|nr:hypothetical protein C4J91_2554 [Pseudomonas sp. R3-52-08]AZF26637.1 hypothetical protein C4J90_2464 [Pseudomonas sp. R2-60-08W]AZF31988.1 hypothetical protein C4J89_2513 [Pseudomonas sp. R4-35-07]
MTQVRKFDFLSRNFHSPQVFFAEKPGEMAKSFRAEHQGV